MTVEEMQQRKRELGLTYEQIAERAGLSVITVQRIINGTTANPRGYTKEFIEMALSQPAVKEGAPAFANAVKKQGEYTDEDYYQLPDEDRYELIDGVLYAMASPTRMHQEIQMELSEQLRAYVKKNGGKCRVMVAPSDVRLEQKTVMQPDVYIECRPRRPGQNCPDFVAEIVSPSSRMKDCFLKLRKYQESGAREYWILDYSKLTITVYLFEENDFSMRIYGFFDRIPVSVWNGACLVDLSPVREVGEFWSSDDEDIEK